jgi:hypothetical protein
LVNFAVTIPVTFHANPAITPSVTKAVTGLGTDPVTKAVNHETVLIMGVIRLEAKR